MLAILAFLISPTALAGGPPGDASPALTRGPHATPPRGDDLQRLIAVNDHSPTIEGASDISATVVIHTVHVKLATDEEWRAYYGSNAFTVANRALETADDAMNSKFGVDLYWYQSRDWDSDPDSGSPDACDLLEDLMADFNPGNSDIVLGFAKNLSVNYGGCAEFNGDEAVVAWEDTNYERWVRAQHEVSHLFGLPDRYPDPSGTHPDDVMEKPYDKPDYWCVAWYHNIPDFDIFSDHAGKFD